MIDRCIRLTEVGMLVFLAAFSGYGFELKTEGREVLFWQEQAGHWVKTTENAQVGIGDSLFIDETYKAALTLSPTCELLLHGPCRLFLKGTEQAVNVDVIQGQVFLSREKPYNPSMIELSVKSCIFTPVGTAAAIKFTPVGEPTTAVIQGSMRMQSPEGKAMLVPAGTFGTYSAANKDFKEGRLSDKAIQALEQWSGKTFEPSPEYAQGGDSPEDAESPEEMMEGNETVAAADEKQDQDEPTAEAEARESSVMKMEPAVQQEPDEPVAEQAAVPSDDKKSAPTAGKPAKSKPAPSTQPPPSPAQAASEEEQPQQESLDQEAEKDKTPKKDKQPDKPVWGFSAGPVTVDNEQWTRIAFVGDIPVWKFGIGLDIELFMNTHGEFDQKGWDFSKESWLESLTRKIRYLRFNHENDPVFIKVGGLDNVTLGYGFIMDRFNNTLHYPDEKLLGLQFYLNDLSPIGITLQTVIPDFLDFNDDGGIVGTRLAVKPMKMTEIPVIKGTALGASYVRDLNQYAPARDWELKLGGAPWDRDEDGIFDSSFWYNEFGNKSYVDYDSLRVDKINDGNYDTTIEHRNQWAKRRSDAFSLFGLDLGIPLIATKLLRLDIYGQYALTLDPTDDDDNSEAEGWGIGAPGARLSVGPMTAQLEFRHTDGLFTPNYFGPYYFDERLTRELSHASGDTVIQTKEDKLIEENLNGLYGRLGFNIADAVSIGGTYQYLLGDNDKTDHRFELTGGIGDLIISRVPKITKAEAYLYKTRIGEVINPVTGKTDNFFAPTPFMYYGFRVGFDIVEGAGLIWDARYTFDYDENGDPQQKVSNIGVQASLTF